MKNKLNLFASFFCLIATVIAGQAQTNTNVVERPTIAMVDFDTRGHSADKFQMLQFTINELIRIGKFQVMDKFDIEYIAKRDSIDLNGCMSKPCLTNAGNKLKVDKIFSGYITTMGDKTVITLRLLDVRSGIFEKATTKSFLKINGSEYKMLNITINEMFDIPNDEALVKKLTNAAELDNSINNPYQLKLRADGPRMGFTYFTGQNSTIMQSATSQGGFNSNPYMFQFGYQFEKQYLNEGNFQALFEVIPMISGLDQGRFIPSMTFLNGLRNNKNGWEFAFGPSFALSQSAQGYLDSAGKWTLLSNMPTYSNKNNFEVIERLDSRGDYNISASFIFAAGRTFKSGKINLPINIYFIPSIHGARFGISMGWNGKDRYVSNP